MRIFSSFLLLTVLVSCSFFAPKTANVLSTASRNVARYDDAIQDISQVSTRVDKLMANIFHAYLLGQVALQEFDRQLVKDAGKAMLDSSYSDLLSIRSLVDSYEEDINELYISL